MAQKPISDGVLVGGREGEGAMWKGGKVGGIISVSEF